MKPVTNHLYQFSNLCVIAVLSISFFACANQCEDIRIDLILPRIVDISKMKFEKKHYKYNFKLGVDILNKSKESIFLTVVPVDENTEALVCSSLRVSDIDGNNLQVYIPIDDYFHHFPELKLLPNTKIDLCTTTNFIVYFPKAGTYKISCEFYIKDESMTECKVKSEPFILKVSDNEDAP